MKFSRYILGTLLLAGMMLPVACTDEIIGEEGTGQIGEAEDDGMVDVTLSFALSDGGVSTRDGEDASGNITGLDLQNIDLLIYSVRDQHDNVLHQYGRGVISKEFQNKDADGKFTTPALKNYTEDDDNNQTLMKVEWIEADKNTKEKVYNLKDTITLRVMRGTVFKLSVWAQSSQTEAFDFNYLTAVKVNYEEAKNNDELRDAFCATSIFSIGQVDSKISMTLTRPFSLVQVGVDSKATDTDPGYIESGIELSGVAQYFNVIENRTIDEEPTTTAKFDLAEIPTETFTVNDYSTNNSNSPSTGSQVWPTPKTYKTISRCFVLVPETTFNTDDDGNYNENGSASNAAGDTKWVTDIYGNTIKLTYRNEKWEVESVIDSNGNSVSNYIYNEEDIVDNWRRDKFGNYLYFRNDKTYPSKLITLSEEGYNVILKNEGGKNGTWQIETVFDANGNKITEEGDTDENKPYAKIVEEFEDFKYEFKEENLVDDNVIYPGTPNDTDVTLGLVSLTLSNSSTKITHKPKGPDGNTLRIRVKRNWRSNVLFSQWSTITNDVD